ncbi:aminotransferase class V-fold PLP-dependent enzyme [Xanthobacter sp. TB0136]|uniref:aminotransferase class V-fold PLP-dependent enzyme n=1 Tax=Xanthobacter sp. TB0136 TaxID=3459177 RepID=UPI004039DE90
MPVYLNAASHGLPERATRERLALEARRELEHPSLITTPQMQAALDDVRQSAARLLDAPAGQIVLGHTTTQTWLGAIARLPLAGRRIIVAPHEWGAHVRILRQMTRIYGLVLEVIPEEEAFAPEAWAARLDEDVAALILPMVTSAEGLRYPVEGIGALPRPPHTLLVVDGAQAFGRIAVSMAALGCDLLVGTARKWLRAPRTTALAALSPTGTRILGITAADLEPYDAHTGLRLALGVALDRALAHGLERISCGLAGREEALRAALVAAQLERWLIRPGEGRQAPPRAPGQVTLAIPAAERPRLEQNLQAARIIAKWCHPPFEEPLSGRATQPHLALLRLTPHLDNTDHEFETVARALRG